MTLKRWFWPVLAGLCFLGAIVMGWRADRAAKAARESALERDRVEAVADSTRLIALDSLKGVLDTAYHAMERRAVQQQQRGDSLDALLGRTRVALVNLTATVRTLSAQATAIVGGDSTARTADFTVRDPPYTARASVRLPPAPATGSLLLKVALDTAPVSLRLQCGKPDLAGVRPATVLATAPRWLTLRFDDVQQEPDVCSPPPKAGGVGKWVVVVAAVAGFLIGSR